MGSENIVNRILLDAESESNVIVADAESKAAKILAEAAKRAENARRETEEETAKRTQAIFEKRAADARLESAKIALAEKRKVIDGVYALALNRLLSLEKTESLALVSSLLERYAEVGDEVVFAENFKFEAEVAGLPVISKKGLRISKERLPLDGGLKLVGEKADKDLSFGALLNADREEYQAELAKKLFQ